MINKLKLLICLVLLVTSVGIAQASTTLYLQKTSAIEPMPNSLQSGDLITHSYMPNYNVNDMNTNYQQTTKMLVIGSSFMEPGFPHYNYWNTWISSPLSSNQTLDGTISLTTMHIESNTNINQYPRIYIYKWLQNDTFGSVLLPPTTSTQETPRRGITTFFNDVPLIPTMFNSGDRIVIEYESYDNNAKKTLGIEELIVKISGEDAALTFSQDITF